MFRKPGLVQSTLHDSFIVFKMCVLNICGSLSDIFSESRLRMFQMLEMVFGNHIWFKHYIRNAYIDHLGKSVRHLFSWVDAWNFSKTRRWRELETGVGQPTHAKMTASSAVNLWDMWGVVINLSLVAFPFFFDSRHLDPHCQARTKFPTKSQHFLGKIILLQSQILRNV